VELSVLKAWASDHSISINAIVERKLLTYANLLHETNKKYNLTGLTSIDGILKNLIIGSIEPVNRLKVPRGTLYADMGSGAGIPGVPVGIIHDHMRGILIESNHKKAMFITSIIQELQLDNLAVYNGRIEEYEEEGARDGFDIVFSRALGDPFYVIEMGAPLLKSNGMLYIYSHLKPEELPPYVRDHSVRLGLSIASDYERTDRGIDDSGLLFLKTGDTESRYPRKISIIKRDITRNSRSNML
jgi:16S rRNA (guanine527-N7)-methyltransferase